MEKKLKFQNKNSRRNSRAYFALSFKRALNSTLETYPLSSLVPKAPRRVLALMGFTIRENFRFSLKVNKNCGAPFAITFVLALKLKFKYHY